MGRRGMLLNIFLAFACLATALKADDAGQSCDTQCGDSCCPHENGVCCEGDSKCCRQGQTCLSNIDTCIGLQPTTHGNVTLHSEKATPVAGLFCPNGTTPCEGSCCPYDDGVCCGDGNCCPNGFQCSPKACVSGAISDLSLKKGLAGKDPEKSIMGQKVIKFGIRICPDKLHLCPISADCCRKDGGQWGCCPKMSNLKTGECCLQWGVLYVCCTDSAPKCHTWGCWY